VKFTPTKALVTNEGAQEACTSVEIATALKLHVELLDRNWVCCAKVQ